jgi:hypothetical protein
MRGGSDLLSLIAAPLALIGLQRGIATRRHRRK